MNRMNLVLLVLLALQVAVLLHDELAPRDGRRPRMTVTTDYLFPDAKAETLQSFTISMGGRTTEVRRGGDGWVVASEGNVPADAAAAADVMRALGSMKPGKIVSENRAKHADFQVDGEQGVLVTATDDAGREVARFVLGKSTPNWSGVYVRYPADGDDVMLVDGNVRHSFTRGDNQPGAWRDRTVLSFDSRRLRWIEIAAPDETIRLERVVAGDAASDDDEWRMTAPVEGPVNRFAANAMAFTLSELQAERHHFGGEPLASLGLDPPHVRVTIGLDGGETLALQIGTEVDGRVRHVRLPEGEDVFLVPSVKLYGFLRPSAEMLEKAPESPAAPAAPASPAGNEDS
jgi:hypothetical protein